MPSHLISPTLASGILHIALDETASTNDYAHQHSAQFPSALTLITAEFQSQGRGAMGSWQSQRSENLIFSLLLRPELPPAQVFRLSVAACISLCRALSSFAPGCTIKWPNDIYHGDCKLCGILIENQLQGRSISECIIGVGVNVNQRQFAPDAPNPTSLALLVGHSIAREPVLEAIVAEFQRALREVQGEAWEATFAAYKRNLYRAQGQHLFRDASGDFAASIADVQEDGHLVLRTAEGKLRRYAFKEVAFLNNPTNT